METKIYGKEEYRDGAKNKTTKKEKKIKKYKTNIFAKSKKIHSITIT
jgi:hypothetical protein